MVFLSQSVDHDCGGLIQDVQYHKSQFILDRRLRSLSFNENNRERWCDVRLYCRRKEERGERRRELTTRLLQQSVPGVPEKLSLLSLLTTPVPPATVCVLFPRFLVMATCYVSSRPHHPSSPRSPFSPPRHLFFAAQSDSPGGGWPFRGLWTGS